MLGLSLEKEITVCLMNMEEELLAEEIAYEKTTRI